MKRTIYLLLAMSVVLASCTGNKQKKENSEKVITVTIEPLRYLTEQIAGDKFKVVSMVPKGSSPETYDPTPQQLVKLGDSKAYFRIGYIGFEKTWLDRLLENTPHMQVFDTSKGVDLIYDTHQHGEGDDVHIHEGVEPHIWNSPINAQIIAKNILLALTKMDKENEEYYTERYNALDKQLEKTDSIVKEELKGADKVFMIYHPALSYFARDYGLKQISIEAGGKEPSPVHLKNLINESRKEGVEVIFVQQEFDVRNAELIAKETGAKIVPINPLSYDWNEEMIHVAKALHHE